MKLKLFFSIAALTLLSGIVQAQSPCDVVQVLHNPQLPVAWSPDSTKYLVNKQDTAGVFQIYLGHAGDTTLTCISLNYPWSFLRPWAQRNKLQVQWHGNDLIICGVEKEFYNELLYLPYSTRLGLLQSGIWMDIFALTPDGNNWYNLATTQHGFTGPAFTPDGSKGAWAEALDSSDLSVDVFGKWRLMLSEFTVSGGVPSFSTTTNINPAGARWIEPGNFSRDGHSLLISSDIGISNAQGQDQYILDITSGAVTNLTNSPMVWDEHGVFSPDGNKILFMSSYPYQADTNSYHTISLKTEFMLMNTDGSGLQQLTHFRTAGYPESSPGIAATGFWTPDGSRIYAQSLIFPDYDNWIIQFYGNCGNSVLSVEEQGTGAFMLYPNPVLDELTVTQEKDFENAEISIVNTIGQTLESLHANGVNSVRVPVDELPPGIYLLRVASGESLGSRVFVKQ